MMPRKKRQDDDKAGGAFSELFKNEPERLAELNQRLQRPDVRAKSERKRQDFLRQHQAAREYVESNLNLPWPTSMEDWRQLANMVLPVEMIESGEWSPRLVIERLQGRADLEYWLRSLLPDDDQEAADNLPIVDETADLTTIFYHAGKNSRTYSANAARPILMPSEAHNFLQAFLDCDEAKDTGALQNAGVSNVSRIAEKINEKFPGSILTPADKGDGYYARVRTLTPTK
jgi:hypothetical protein